MSDCVQITLIICVTIIILNIISDIHVEYKSDEGIEKCKTPTYPRPPKPGYQPQLTKHDNSELEIMRKPPSAGSGIK